jgi:hypothetical protein
MHVRNTYFSDIISKGVKMKFRLFLNVIALIAFFSCSSPVQKNEVTMSIDTLKDKIKGGWAGQVIGVTFGGPTEFRYCGSFIEDYYPIPWYDGYLKETFEKSPGLYDDVYMDLTFVQVFEEKGLDAPAAAFAKAFAYAEYRLWHANQAARHNILKGIMPPQSGHWLNNPHADDIDFQIEADFAGIMCPGMPKKAGEICDTVGHIMNFGDGWYGGVYVAAMYSLAFVSDDVNYIVKEALKTIPVQSKFYKCMADVIMWYEKYPDDWKETWFELQKKWAQDIGCPHGVFSAFNIDAVINSAYILLGLLYGQGDFGKTLSISTRAGQDSDCNPASAGGILGVMLRHALMVIKENNGSVTDKDVTIKIQKAEPVRLEQGFEGHYPVDKKRFRLVFNKEATFDFTGIGFSICYWNIKNHMDSVFKVQMFIDGEYVETSDVTANDITKKNTPFWRYQLAMGKHKVEFKVLNPQENTEIIFRNAIIYGNKPKAPKY